MGSTREESALNMFRQMDLKGQAQDDTQLNTVHQNTISTLRIYEEAGGFVRKFSSKFPSSRLGSGFMGSLYVTIASGVDGRVVIWPL
jgi:actin related protein 2/3 complex subunit 1A/1B